ncbi:hypothetical protein SAMN05216199_3317 [Pedococcus cremeus]|uniref:Glycosyltransferase RgtA/B/C/D-like domain-containing protein n=1 Tax=Pedococcus cremeus TaxID=587636 RepID=A0A1H9X185_9MICO|nr:hypothetical protein [Pedococcus cremeus]SES39865.1 hypothetical protein SAMN05216199_3317 [Pedococcus cremeus]
MTTHGRASVGTQDAAVSAGASGGRPTEAPTPAPQGPSVNGLSSTGDQPRTSAVVADSRALGISAATVLAIGLLLRGWVGWRGFFYLDDFVFTARAATHSVFDAHYLLEPYNSHFMPGSYVWVWVLTRLLPFNYGAVVVTSMLLQGVLGVLFYVLLRRLFGSHLLILVPFTMFVLTPMTLPANLWWAAALNQLPQQLALVGVLLAHVTYLRTGRTARGLVGPFVLLAGLAFSEKTLLALPLLLAFTVLFFAAGRPLRRTRDALVQHRIIWAGYAVVTVPYMLFYVSTVPSPARQPGTGASVVQLVMESFVRAVVPAILGGPWHWAQIGYAGALADPGPFACAVALVVLAGVVAGSCLARRGAWRGWALALGYAVTNLVLLVVSRAAFIGPVIAGEYRYVTDVALVAALGLALALVPLSGQWRAGRPATLDERPALRRWLDTDPVRELLDELPRPRAAAWIAVAVTALTVSAAWSTVSYDQFWRINPARPWVETARSELSGYTTPPVLADGYVPQEVAWALLGDYATVSHLLSPLPTPPRTLADGPTSDSLYMLDDRGRVRRAAVSGVSALPGPRKGCGWRIGAQPVTVPLQRSTLPFSWTVRIGYISSGTTKGAVTIGGTRTPVEFHAGLGAVFLRANGAFDEVRLETAGDGAVVCSDDITVGAPVPVQEAR